MSLAKKRRKKPRKGFTRSKKEWEESAAGHIGKFIDRLRPADIIDLIALLGISYYGYELTHDARGPIVGAIGYKLATTMGGTPPVAQIAGLSILGAMGLTILGKMAPYSIDIAGFQIPQALPDPITYIKEKIEEKEQFPGYAWRLR